MDDHKQVEMLITPGEASHLSDVLSVYIHPIGEFEEYNPYDLILKVGAAIIDGKEIPIMVIEPDLLSMREKVKSFAKVGTEPVGINLLTKITNGLRIVTAYAKNDLVVVSPDE